MADGPEEGAVSAEPLSAVRPVSDEGAESAEPVGAAGPVSDEGAVSAEPVGAERPTSAEAGTEDVERSASPPILAAGEYVKPAEWQREDESSRRIQAAYRGRQARAELARDRAAATKIQAVHRGRGARARYAAERDARESAASSIQRATRRRQSQKAGTRSEEPLLDVSAVHRKRITMLVLRLVVGFSVEKAAASTVLRAVYETVAGALPSLSPRAPPEPRESRGPHHDRPVPQSRIPSPRVSASPGPRSPRGISADRRDPRGEWGTVYAARGHTPRTPRPPLDPLEEGQLAAEAAAQSRRWQREQRKRELRRLRELGPAPPAPDTISPSPERLPMVRQLDPKEEAERLAEAQRRTREWRKAQARRKARQSAAERRHLERLGIAELLDEPPDAPLARAEAAARAFESGLSSDTPWERDSPSRGARPPSLPPGARRKPWETPPREGDDPAAAGRRTPRTEPPVVLPPLPGALVEPRVSHGSAAAPAGAHRPPRPAPPADPSPGLSPGGPRAAYGAPDRAAEGRPPRVRERLPLFERMRRQAAYEDQREDLERKAKLENRKHERQLFPIDGAELDSFQREIDLRNQEQYERQYAERRIREQELKGSRYQEPSRFRERVLAHDRQAKEAAARRAAEPSQKLSRQRQYGDLVREIYRPTSARRSHADLRSENRRPRAGSASDDEEAYQLLAAERERAAQAEAQKAARRAKRYRGPGGLRIEGHHRVPAEETPMEYLAAQKNANRYLQEKRARREEREEAAADELYRPAVDGLSDSARESSVSVAAERRSPRPRASVGASVDSDAARLAQRARDLEARARALDELNDPARDAEVGQYYADAVKAKLAMLDLPRQFLEDYDDG